MPELTLIHTSDFHNRLTPARAERLAESKDAHRALLLDTGDAILAPNLFAFPWPEPAIRLMNRAGHDAMCLGNREYTWCRGGLLRKTRDARFPVLCANLKPRRRDLGHLQRWAVLESPTGVSVGVFGLTEIMIRPGSLIGRLASSEFLDYEEAAKEAVAALRDRVQVVVALCHFSRRQEAQVARAVPGIDLMLCGHWHEPEPSLEMVGTVALARTFHHGRGAAILTLDGNRWEQKQVRL